MKLAVIGGANIDIRGITCDSFKFGTSNPGFIYKTSGGVARNIAENLGRLRLRPTIFTVIGDDEEGKWLKKYTQQSGVDVSNIKCFSHERTGICLSILDEKREQIGSISDMKIMDKIDAAYIKSVSQSLVTAELSLVDTNISHDTLVYIINWLNERKVPVIVDPVSVKKCHKLKENLSKIDLFLPNKEEAETLSNIPIKSKGDLYRNAEFFLSKGLKKLVITLGKEGVFAFSESEENFLFLRPPPIPPTRIKDSTGAGDAFAAGVIYGISKGQRLLEACKYGMVLSIITLEREETVAPDLTPELLEEKKKEIFD